jgi:hypothetical protein
VALSVWAGRSVTVVVLGWVEVSVMGSHRIVGRGRPANPAISRLAEPLFVFSEQMSPE